MKIGPILILCDTCTPLTRSLMLPRSLSFCPGEDLALDRVTALFGNGDPHAI